MSRRRRRSFRWLASVGVLALTGGLALVACPVADGSAADAGDAGGLDGGGDGGDVGSDGGDGLDAGQDGGVPLVDPDCTNDGCLRRVFDLGPFSLSELEPLLAEGVDVDNGYQIWFVRYFTNGREARATITIPIDVDVPADGFHIAVNNHGTAGLDDECAVGSQCRRRRSLGLFRCARLHRCHPGLPGPGDPRHASLSREPGRGAGEPRRHPGPRFSSSVCARSR